MGTIMPYLGTDFNRETGGRAFRNGVADFVRASAVDTTSVSSSDGESEIGELPL